MRVQSIRTAIEPRNPTGDCLFVTPREMPLGKVHRVAELHDLAKKVGPVAEALQNARHLLPTGFPTPFVVDGSHVASRIGIFNQFDLGLFVAQAQSSISLELYHGANFRNIDFRWRRHSRILGWSAGNLIPSDPRSI